MLKVINLGSGEEIPTMIVKICKTREEAMEYIKKNKLRVCSDEGNTLFVEPDRSCS